METSFVLNGVRSEYTAPAAMLPPNRQMRRARPSMSAQKTDRKLALAQRAVLVDNNWTFFDEAVSTGRRNAATAGTMKLVTPCVLAHHRASAQLVARDLALAPIVSITPSLVLSVASPNSPNASPVVAHVSHIHAVGLLEAVAD